MRVDIPEEYTIFGKILKIGTFVGIGILIVSLILYLINAPSYISLENVIKTWDLPVSKFWEVNTGKGYGGLSELVNIQYSDNIGLIGVAILSAVPLIGLLAILPKLNLVYKILAILVIIESLIVIIKPV